MERSILHCDMNNFFASVECMLNPSIKDFPVAVCGNEKERHGIVLAKNYKAKDKGIKTGDAIWQAKSKCPGLIIIDEPHYDEYIKYSELARNIYLQYTDLVEPMGLDECWLDVTNSIKLFGNPNAIADKIRDRIRNELNLTISVGVSFNKTFAKLGSDMKKPDATTVITKENFKSIVWPLPVSDLLGVGRKTNQKLSKYFIYTIGDLASESVDRLEYLFGKNGVMLYYAANGLEDDEVHKYEDIDPVKSISHGITTVKDLENDDEVWLTILELSLEIGLKLRYKNMRAGGVTISIRNCDLEWEQFSSKFKSSEQSSSIIADYAFKLFKEKYDWKKPIRTLTIGVMYLNSDDIPEQISVFDYLNKKDKIEKCIEDINYHYGAEIVKNASLYNLKKMPKTRRKINYDDKK